MEEKHVLRHLILMRLGAVKQFLAGLAFLVGTLLAPVANAADPTQGPGGPVLIVTSSTAPFSTYYAEILRTEGLNAFKVVDVAAVNATLLASYDVVIVGKMTVPSAQVTALTNWVSTGGSLIVMAPDASLASVLGITPTGTTLTSGYMLVDTSSSPGYGIVGETMQFHSPASLFTTNGASRLATLYSDAATPTTYPAVTINTSGAGRAAAFAFDLAQSVVYTRQGNPAWAAQERDGLTPIRSDDKFFGASSTDNQKDWIDLTKVAIPQADEQQRLLLNLVQRMDAKPLPRFWYLPNGKKAVVVMTGDDHANGGTLGRFDQYVSMSAPGCSLANWECIRGTSYIYPGTPITDAQAAQYNAQGFEIGLHVTTDCTDYTMASLTSTYQSQMTQWKAQFPSLPNPITERHHCIVWSDWTSGAQVELANAIRLDTTYYYWPPTWVNNVPGLFTGTAMPMRFANLDGTFVDVYQVVSQMTDESGQTYPYTVDTLLDRATGPLGYYGVYTINAHTDQATSAESDAVITSAMTHGVPVVTGRQMLTWLDARNASSFGSQSWSGGALSFVVTHDPSANGLQGMLPIRTQSGVLTGLTRSGASVSTKIVAVKGVEYAFFAADAGPYVATYAVDNTPPQVASTSPAAGSTGVLQSVQPTIVFNEGMDPSTINTSTIELRDASNSLVSATVTYDINTRSAILKPAGTLQTQATYTVTVHGGATDPRVKDGTGNALVANASFPFTTVAVSPCPCNVLGSATPGTPSVADSTPVEVGVRFTSDTAGYISGIRFYKGTGNSGTHTGDLWTNTGTLLARVTFTGETSSGWQQASFATPVQISANTTYVASYFAPAGNYAADAGYFATAGVDKAPLHLLKDGVAGGNGAYGYGSAPTFPTSSYNSTNYWVEPILVTSTSDTTVPTVASMTPVSGASSVDIGSLITATFSEAIDPATLTTSTVLVSTAANVAIPGTVTYDATNRIVTFAPSAALPGSTQINVKLLGGTTDPRVKDLAGNALAANYTWSFTTAAGAQVCPCGVFGTSTPTNPSASDSSPVELGVRFTSDVAGYISGVRFYKGTPNTGTHIGDLWTNTGTLLARATFTSETASGWQQVSFATPVQIAANTTYVASYFAPAGNYAADSGYFASTGVDKPPLHLLKNGTAGGNGTYAYASAPTFPGSTYNSTNYWVEPLFVTNFVDTTAPTVTATTPTSGATGVSASSVITATFSEALDASTVSSSTVVVKTAANVAVAGTVSYGASSNTITFTPSSALPVSTQFIVTLLGGTTDPRLKDVAGNALAANVSWTFTTAAGSTACASPANAIVAENCLAGTPSSQWDVTGAGDASIQGFATQISVNKGTAVQFKVSTNASAYRFDIYRMGYYAGLGARLIATVNPTATLPQAQPNCLSDASTGLLDCGNWGVSGAWTVPATAVSGIYFAKVTRTDTGGASHIFFVVRDDSSHSALLYQTSDTTWQAYNEYGGNSLYVGQPAGRAYKVSYNRPFTTRTTASGQDWVFNAEYPMVRWLESNGYDVSYFSGVDADRSGSLILNHKAFLSVGHDEYWSAAQRANVEAARGAGVHLAFFSGNEVFWKTRWETSIDGTGTAYRTLVCYKETTANAKIDPTATWTGTWRDPRFSPPADGNRPENALTGTLFMNNDTGAPYSITVTAADGKMRLWRNTSIASLGTGTTATLPLGTLGYEWDIDADNGQRPAGLFRMSTTTLTTNGVLQDYGSTYGTGTQTHSLTSYKASSGARVFSAGTIQWTWGLDANHDRGNTAADPRMQQATVNLLADMGAQPTTLQSGLVAATATTDVTAPTSAITSPAAGAAVTLGTPITIAGTATDAGGGVVGGVEVSVDGGTTWHPATGRATWTFGWTPSTVGSATIKTRAVDDSGNLETAGAGRTVTVQTPACPCSIFFSSAVPGTPDVSDGDAVNVGMKFRADSNGKITGARFYKGAGNTGTHVATLWTAAGVSMGTVTFTNETATGWQQANFATPISVTANTVYVISYLATRGHYAGDNGGFANAVDTPPLHALKDGASGGNGVYLYATTSKFPTSTWSSSNYWVDVVFTQP